MNRPSRSERLAAKGLRPKRRAAANHLFKYQLANNPSRAEENDLKRALQESLEEHCSNNNHNRNHNHLKNHPGPHSNANHVVNSKRASSGRNQQNNASNSIVINSSTNSSDISTRSTTSSSNISIESISSPKASTPKTKRTRSSIFIDRNTPNDNTNNNKRAKLGHDVVTSNGHNDLKKCDAKNTSETHAGVSPPSLIHRKAIKTYSRNQLQINDAGNKKQSDCSKSESDIVKLQNGKETPRDIRSPSIQVSKPTQTRCISVNNGNVLIVDATPGDNFHNISNQHALLVPSITRDVSTATPPTPTPCKSSGKISDKPVPEQNLKLKRESKNYAYVKMTALKVSTSKSPSSNNKSSNSKKSSPNSTTDSSNLNQDSFKISQRANLSDKCEFPGISSSSGSKQNNSGLAKISNGMKSDTISGKKSPPNSSASSKGNKNNDVAKSSKATKNVSSFQLIGDEAQRQQNCTVDNYARSFQNNCLLDDTVNLSIKQAATHQTNVKLAKKRLNQGSWSLLGVPEEKLIYLRDDEPPRRLICYPAIKHVEGDVIQVRDSVLLRSGARITDLPYIAKVIAFWEDAETGGVMMSLFWYYRPEHTEEGRKTHHLVDEIFASRHRDMDSVECIEDKCYVLTFNEYCRYRKRCKMEQVGLDWSLTDITVPAPSESYPRRNRIPDSDVNPELVFCCRQIYDSRTKRLVKNPLISPKYGHI